MNHQLAAAEPDDRDGPAKVVAENRQRVAEQPDVLRNLLHYPNEQLRRDELDRAVASVSPDCLTFAELAFENVHTERVEDLALDRSLQRARAVDRIVALRCDARFRRVAEFEADLLLLE